MIRCAVVVLLVGRVVAADPIKLLHEGQRLEGKDPKAAEAKLQQALAESPNDPRILAELGYAALLAKDYATAETMTRKAIATATDAKIKAAAEFNLGKILAAKGGPFTPRTLDGPYPSIDKFCATWTRRKDPDRDQYKVTDTCGELEDVTAPALDGHAVKLVSGGWETPERIHHTWHFVAIQLPAGWFVGKVDEIMSAGGTGEGNMALELGAIKVITVDAGLHALMIPDHMSVTDTDERDHEVTSTSDELVLCAIGKSGKPSCTGTVIVGKHRHVNDDKDATTWALAPSFPGKGVLQLTVDKQRAQGKPDEPPDAQTLGAHALAFP